jgi:hypothetical protein
MSRTLALAEFRHSAERSIRIDCQFQACPDLIEKLPFQEMLVTSLFFRDYFNQ